ncbi:putative secreted lipase [Teratosphaeria destructans]|uniref:Carboxylic ester hydrolase n=1 Tax=Teratosphaeria destructans TaxID=418781 RepID=A0A9W7SYA8_9PEZI|nr:putative secreted lipase [Teratosphaeria destructans]
MHTSLLAALLPALALAAPSVTIKNGTIVGTSLLGVDSFKGIPYAKPPTGTLRLKPPQTIDTSYGTITSNPNPRSCPQFFAQLDTTEIPSSILAEVLDSPAVQAAEDAGEDCLTINVQRPSSATSNSSLPVVFWIFGGGFEFGSTSMYDGSNFVTKSIELGADVIYVAVNYRVSGFGFLAGSELAAEHATNLGLRDQRLGLQWVAENIAAFGGDPDKVTLWGESAGSISVFDHTVINGGDNTYNGKALFRGGIMNSGSIVPADPVTAPQAQAIYNSVVPYSTFLAATEDVPAIFGYHSLDLSYLPRPDPGDTFLAQSPELSVQSGAYAKVPVIIGDEQDEGTLFALSLSNITTNAQVVDYLASYFPSNPNAHRDVAAIMATYPDQPLLGQPAGSPFNTGSLNNIYPQYKRLAAVLGDLTFTLTRRYYISLIWKDVDVWSYLNTYFHGTPVIGTAHALDVLVDYGDGPLELTLDTNAVQEYYISFVNDLDPNSLGTSAPLIDWPKWSNSSGNPQLVDFGATGLSLITDDFRSGTYNTIVGIGPAALRA